MKKTLTRLAPHQAGKVAAIIYLPIAVLMALVMGVSSGMSGSSYGMTFGIAALVAYPLLAYLATAIGCLLYNVVASRFGGIEMTLTDVDDGTPA